MSYRVLNLSVFSGLPSPPPPPPPRESQFLWCGHKLRRLARWLVTLLWKFSATCRIKAKFLGLTLEALLFCPGYSLTLERALEFPTFSPPLLSLSTLPFQSHFFKIQCVPTQVWIRESFNIALEWGAIWLYLKRFKPTCPLTQRFHF